MKQMVAHQCEQEKRTEEPFNAHEVEALANRKIRARLFSTPLLFFSLFTFSFFLLHHFLLYRGSSQQQREVRIPRHGRSCSCGRVIRVPRRPSISLLAVG